MDGLLSLVIFVASFYLMMRFGCGAHMMRGHGRYGRHDAGDHTTRTDA